MNGSRACGGDDRRLLNLSPIAGFLDEFGGVGRAGAPARRDGSAAWSRTVGGLMSWMSASRIARSPDLARLTEEGHELALLNDRLPVRGLPYVGRTLVVLEGTLVVPLHMRGDAGRVPAGVVVAMTAIDADVM